MAFAQIAEENDGKTVVVGTHGGIIRALRAAWDKIPLFEVNTGAIDKPLGILIPALLLYKESPNP